MTLVARDPEPTRRRTRAHKPVITPIPPVPYWLRGLRWIAVARRLYTTLVLMGGCVLLFGIALFSVPLALVVAGLAVGLLGLIGLGFTVRVPK